MNADYTYCFNKASCIHRRGCKRWIGNYTDEEVHKLYSENKFVHEIDDEDCMMEEIEDDKILKYPFDMLDRFRLSDGTEMKK